MLTGYDGSTITYDTFGNPENDDTYTYEWIQGRRLASISNGDDLEVSYQYNDSGIRTQKTVNGVTTDYHMVGRKVTYEKTVDGGEIYYAYGSIGELVSFSLNGPVVTQ